MVNVIDNTARNRTNMMPVGIKIIDDKGDVAHTAKTDLGTNYISLESKWFDSSSNNTGGSTGGNTGGSTGGNTSGGTTGGNTGGGTAPSQVSQLPSTVNLFSGSAVGNILLSGPSANYDNVQDGLLITLSNQTLADENYSLTQGYSTPSNANHPRVDISSIGLKTIKIPKEQLTVGNSFDISNQLSQYIGKTVQVQYNLENDLTTWNNISSDWPFSVGSFEGTTIKVLPNTTISMNLTVYVKDKSGNQAFNYGFPIPVIRVNTYKN
ncbi:hypothetical protein CPR18618_PPKEINIP_00916 [Companilactobacillus paralimentarius]|uniref:hypothetical protein n=1 Tax=Companilactobacillus paralimentarius TaxID=83526 RepID=UPI00385027C9